MISALIIAAGRTAYRDNFEIQKQIGNISAIQRIVKVFQCAGIERVTIICGDDGSKIERLVSHMNVTFLPSPANAEIFDNLKTGLLYLQDKCTAALITHVDIPLFSVETVRLLIASAGQACIPSYKGNIGYPLLLRSEHFQTVLSHPCGGELPEAVKASGLKCNFLEVDDEGVLFNVHYENDYGHLVAKHSLTQVHTEARIRLVKEKPFYGPGAHQLLQLTGETNSLREACRYMGISYSKGRGIISLIERQLECPVIESRQGGKSGGSSAVTEEGKDLMRRYSEFCVEAKQSLDELFSKYFPPTI